MSGVVAFEGELNAIVKEYLEFNNFDRTMNEFECECTSRGNPIASYDGQTKKTDHKAHTMQEEMMECFTLGLRDDFFSQWVENIPEKIRNEDSVAQKLEFYVHIYFAIYPMKYNTKDIDERMSYFKTYLETRGASLSQTTEFLPFYALPFVPNPKTHPSYKELFNDRWVPDLQIRLEKFLVLVLQSSTQPRLFELYKGSVGSPSDLKNLQKMAHDSDRKTNTYIKRYNRIQGDYHNLIGITADLVDTLEATVQGRPVSPGYLQKVCQRLFSNQVRQSVDITRPGTAGEVLRQSVLPPQGIQHKENMHGSSLDYDKIKRDLQDGNERTKGLLLQALRWKLTKTPPPERDAMLAAYIQYDILGCASDSSYRKAAENLLTSGSVIVEQYTARVYNAFASLTEGRQYLSQNGNLVKSLLLNLRNGKGDAVCQENILGCLQKLSLRRQQQSVMIEDGVIEWLVSILADDDELSDYMLEYSVALLMNLCLRTAGKRRCADSAYKVLKVLSDLLGHNNQEIIPYVNGALYSILAIPSIREEAISMDMEDILKCFIKDGQADMNRQIEFIIKQLNSDEAPEDFESDDEEEEEEEEEQDAMEADLDKAELIKPQSNELHGNRLLHTHYAGSVSPNQKKRKATDNVSGVDDLLTRPVTPLQRKGGETPVVHVQPRSGRPPTGQSRSSSRGSSRGSSRSEVHRPPTRSGSCASSLSDTPREPPAITTDREGSEIVSKAVGSNKKLAVAMDEQNKPSKRAMEKVSSKQVDVAEYGAAFGSRPRIARTPDVSSHHQSGSGRSSRTSHSSGGSRPTSRGSFSEGPTPQPKYSDSLPTSRPNSGGRPNSSGNTKPPSPAMKQRSNREHSETESRKGSHRVKRH